jgi:catalase
VAYCPANIVPGIDFTNDPLLQGRLFSYLDTQKSRLGTANFHQIPINAPKCPVMNFQRDGQMQMNVPTGRANYEPNSLAEHGADGGPRECPLTGFTTVRGRVANQEQGDKLRVRAELFADHYSQARLFWKSMTESEQAHIASSFTFELSKVQLEQVAPRMIGNLLNVDEELAQRVADGIGIALPKKNPARAKIVDMKPSPALSIHKNMKATLQGRMVGILIADGSDSSKVLAVQKAVAKDGGKCMIVAPKLGGAKMKGGKTLKADGQLLGTPSQLFDAVAIILSEEGCEALTKEGAALQFVMDAFGHLKAIGASEAAKPLLDRAGVKHDEGVTGLGTDFVEAARQRFWDREPNVRTLA